MPDSPLVTVVLTSYNHGPFIEQALRSVLDQSVRNIEVLLIDDASSDDTAERVSRFNDPRLRVIASAVNRGLHHRNLAMRQARGSYVALQNSDDIWRSDKLAAQVEFLEANPSYGACFTAVDLCDEAGAPCPGNPVYGGLFKVEQHSREQWLHRFYHQGNCLALPSAMLRMSVLRQTELMDPSLFQCGDWDLWVQIAALSELHVCPEPLTVVRVRSQGRNLSAPTAASHNRTLGEAVRILQRFARAPILGQAERIFGQELESTSAADTSAEISSLIRLGVMATASQHRHHRLAGIEFLRLGLLRGDREGGLSQETRARAAHRLFLISGELAAQAEPVSRVQPDWVGVSVQLFWRSEASLFSEERSRRIDCSISFTPIRLQIEVPPPGEPIESVRLDLANRPLRMLLLELVLYDSARQELWRCPSEWARDAETRGMSCHRSAEGPGIVVDASDDDPQWILPLPPTACACLDNGGTLEIVIQRV